jgi:heme-degrading monooxygenase HmoA
MHVRVTTINGAAHIDEGVAFVKDQVVPEVRQQRGYRGLTVSGDRSGGIVAVLSLWETEQDMNASESTASKLRPQAVGIFGGEVSVATYEQMVAEVGDTPPGPGSALRVIQVKMDPAQVDDNVAFFRAEVLPQIKATPGFRGVRNLINRATGEGAVGTVWADQASLQAATAEAQKRMQQAEARGIEFGESSVREVLFSDLP